MEQIPLVLYIPAPPDDEGTPITVPPSVYTYPPKPRPAPPRKRRFAFLRRSKKEDAPKTGKESKGSKDKKVEINTWEDNWEAGEYPFVRLEGNRASCAICLMDFEEPKRVNGEGEAQTNDQNKAEQEPNTVPAGEGTSIVQVDGVIEVPRSSDPLKLEDAGEGAQPLRLLACGHVFHVCYTYLPVYHPTHGLFSKHVWILGLLMYLGAAQYVNGRWKYQNLLQRRNEETGTVPNS